MKIVVVGGGGREHAIIKKIKENPQVTELYALPGNGGIAKDATCVDIAAKDVEAWLPSQRKRALILLLLHRMILWFWVWWMR